MLSSTATDNESFIESLDPVTGELAWRGPRASSREIEAVMVHARKAQVEWRRKPFAERTEFARAFARAIETRAPEMALMISRENGKPLWEARAEASAVVAKVELSIKAHGIRCHEFEGGGAVTRFQPHGVVVVLGPFNFPAHLPNGHIVPALLAGNAVVFKPSEHTPGVADLMARCWREAGLPHGLCQVLQGGASLGEALATHGGCDGVFFTGSESVGRKLLQVQSLHPGKILALEMGGNNPLVLSDVEDAGAAAALIAQSAFLSAGQRCTCARRLIVIDEAKESNNVLHALVHIARTLAVGHYNDQPEPFMGPVISNQAADRILNAQAALMDAGGNALLRAERLRANAPLLRPGILEVTDVPNRPDEEIFGPLLQVIRVRSFDEALATANDTRFGLAAGLVGGTRDLYERFRDGGRAGIINWNRPLTGASGAAPFGGIGQSGNHRPSAFFAADYCAYPVASMESEHPEFPKTLPPGMAIRT